MLISHSGNDKGFCSTVTENLAQDWANSHPRLELMELQTRLKEVEEVGKAKEVEVEMEMEEEEAVLPGVSQGVGRGHHPQAQVHSERGVLVVVGVTVEG